MVVYLFIVKWKEKITKCWNKHLLLWNKPLPLLSPTTQSFKIKYIPRVLIRGNTVTAFFGESIVKNYGQKNHNKNENIVKKLRSATITYLKSLYKDVIITFLNKIVFVQLS